MNEHLETDSLAGERLDRVAEHIQCRLGGRVRDVQVLPRNQGVVLRGHAHTYYAKQLAQEAFLEAADFPLLANEIDIF